MIYVAIINDHTLFRQSLISVIESEKSRFGIDVWGEAESSSEFLNQLKVMKKLPDIALVGIQMKDMNGIQLVDLLSTNYKSIKSIVISNSESSEFVKNAVLAGARAYLSKKSSLNELEDSIKDTYFNGCHFNEFLSQELLLESIKNSEQEGLLNFRVCLTQREKEIAILLTQQLSSKDIGAKLFISKRTVETHRKNILEKIGASKTVGIATYVNKVGWI